MKINRFIVFVSAIMCCVNVFAQHNHYSYSRKISGIDAQWHSITLPNEVVKNTRSDFYDLRILGVTSTKDTLEAPYLLKIGEDQVVLTEVPFKQLNTSKNGKGYYYTFEVQHEESINNLDLNFKKDNFDFNIKIEGSQDQREWFSLVENYRMVSIQNSNVDFKFTHVEFPDAKYKYFRVFVKSSVDPILGSASLFLKKTVKGKYNEYAATTIVEEDKTKKQTIINIDFKEPLALCRLNLTMSDAFDYYRPVSIQYLSDSVKTEKGWKYHYSTLVTGTLNSVRKNEFQFKSIVLSKLKIIIDNDNNTPLHLLSVKTEGYVYELVARFTTPAEYSLVYGNSMASQPNYDISHFTNNIPDSLSRLTLSEEESLTHEEGVDAEPLFENLAWLWGIMALIILVLAYFSVKMLKGK